MHVSGEGQPAHHGHCADGVDHVVHVKAVTRALPLADASQGSSEAIAEPVHRETHNGGKQHAAITDGDGTSDASRELCRATEEHPPTGSYTRGHPVSHADEGPLL